MIGVLLVVFVGGIEKCFKTFSFNSIELNCDIKKENESCCYLFLKWFSNQWKVEDTQKSTISHLSLIIGVAWKKFSSFQSNSRVLFAFLTRYCLINRKQNNNMKIYCRLSLTDIEVELWVQCNGPVSELQLTKAKDLCCFYTFLLNENLFFI